MRILYCNKYNFRFSGTEAYLFDAMELMRSRSHEAALFSMADDRGPVTPYDRHFVPVTDFKRHAGLGPKSGRGKSMLDFVHLPLIQVLFNKA